MHYLDWLFRKIALIILTWTYYIMLPMVSLHDTVFSMIVVRGILWAYGIRYIYVHGTPQSNVLPLDSGLLKFMDTLIMKLVQHEIRPLERGYPVSVDIVHDDKWHNYKPLTDWQDIHVYFPPYTEQKMEDVHVIDVIQNPRNWSRYVTLASSFAFLTIVIHAMIREKYIIALLWFAILCTSLVNHLRLTEDALLTKIDEIVVGGATIAFLYIVVTRYSSKINWGLSMGVVAIMTVMFFVGRLTQTYCFDPDEQVAYRVHQLFHVATIFLAHYCLYSIKST